MGLEGAPAMRVKKATKRLLNWLGDLGTIQGLPDQWALIWKWLKRLVIVIGGLYAWLADVRWEIKVPLAITVVAGLMVIIRVVVDALARPKPSSGDETLFVSQEFGFMPKQVEGGRVRVIDVAYFNGGGELTEVFVSGGGEFCWAANGRSVSGYKCQVVNYGKTVATDVILPIVMTFRAAIKQDGGGTVSGNVTSIKEMTMTIAKIDPGPDRASVFYVYNSSRPEFVDMKFQTTATLRLLGDNNRRPVLVALGNTTLRGMTFPPSNDATD